MMPRTHTLADNNKQRWARSYSLPVKQLARNRCLEISEAPNPQALCLLAAASARARLNDVYIVPYAEC